LSLKNGKKVTVGSESWRCPEGMFQPSLMGLDIAGVHGNVFNAIQKSPIDVRNELFGHIVLSGGSTLFPGFAERLHKEVRMLMNVASQRHLNIVSSHKRKYAAWIGAAGFAALDTFPSTTLFIDDYFDGALEKHLAAQGRTCEVKKKVKFHIVQQQDELLCAGKCWQAERVLLCHCGRNKSTADIVRPANCSSALFGRGQRDQHIAANSLAAHIAIIDIPTRRNVERYDRHTAQRH
jgi:hypothetical protein